MRLGVTAWGGSWPSNGIAHRPYQHDSPNNATQTPIVIHIYWTLVALHVCQHFCLYNLLERVRASRIHPASGADAAWELADLQRLLASQVKPRQALPLLLLPLLLCQRASAGLGWHHCATGCFSFQSWAVL